MSAQLIRALLLAMLTALVALPVGRFVAPWAGWTLFSVGLGLQLWLPGLALWIVGHSLAVWGARLDAQFMAVFARHIKHRMLLDV